MKRAITYISALLLLILSIVPTLAWTINGVVVDKAGKPIEGASVKSLVMGETVSKDQLIKTANTDKNGKFSIAVDVKEGRAGALLFVLKEGYCFGRGHAVSDKNEESKISLYPEQKLTGKVIDEDGKPVSGALVSIEHVSAYDGKGEAGFEFNFYTKDTNLGDVTTAEDGSFTIRHLPDPDGLNGFVDVNVSKTGRAQVKKHIDLPDIKKPLDVTTPKGCELTGTVYLPQKTGTVPEGTDLMVLLVADKDRDTREAKVDKDGKFEFTGLPAGKIRVMLGPQCWYWTDSKGKIGSPEQKDWVLKATDYELAPGESKNVELVTTSGGIIKGKIINQITGKPYYEAIVCANHEGRPDGSTPTCVHTNENGEFSVSVAPGDVVLSVTMVPCSNGHINFQPSETPVKYLKVEEGQKPVEVVINANHADSSQARSMAEKLPVPQDLQLKPDTYNLKWDTETLYDDNAGWSSKPINEAKDKIVKLPALVSSSARFESFKFDGEGDAGELIVVFDESKGTGTGWDTAYIDANRNRDLSDDAPVRWKPRGSLATLTDWVPVQSHQGSGDSMQSHYSRQVRLQTYTGRDGLSVQIDRKGAWRGTVDSNKGKLDCILYDRNNNGIYGDTSDCLFLDTNGFGAAVTADYGPHYVNISKNIKLCGRVYSITSNGVGNQLAVADYSGDTGKLLVKGNNISGLNGKAAKINLEGEQGRFSLEDAAGKPYEVPAGTYKLRNCDLEIESGRESKTTIYCFFVNTNVEIRPGQTTEFVISGEVTTSHLPDHDKYTVKANSREDKDFNWNIKVGDNMTMFTFVKDKKLADPVLKYYDSKGRLVKTIDSRWMCGSMNGNSYYALNVPDLKPGEYTVEIIMDTMTRLGKLIDKRKVVVEAP